MRVPADVRRRRRPRNRAGLIAIGTILFFVLTSVRGIAGFYTDYLWFGELGLTSVWRGLIGAKVFLALTFSALFFVVLLVNLVIADRLAPRFRPVSAEDQVVQRYRQMVGGHAAKLRVAVALMFALLAGGGVSAQWNNWILFRNGVSFGVKDPQFGKDVGFFVFKLPFLAFVVDWAFVALVVVAVVTASAHYLNGGIRLQTPGQRVTAQVKAHLSVLLGMLALIQAGKYFLRRYELNFSTRGVVDGATYTDVNAQLRAFELLILISLVAFVLFLLNIRRRGWVLPAIGVGLWAFVALIVGTIIPALMQNFVVNPAEIRKERPFIERNIKATRAAYGLDAVEEKPFVYDEKLTAAGLSQNSETVRNVRLWDPKFVGQTFQKLQEIRGYYQFNEPDIDRYRINDKVTQTIVSARELNPGNLPGSESWVNRHLSYTHGFGAVVAPANAVTPDGKPDFVLSNVPPVGSPELKQPRLYYGERIGGYAIVNSGQREIDFQRTDNGETEFSTYDGAGGVRLDSLLRRGALALRFADVNFLLSNLVTPQSRAIYIRDINERVRTAAPFLRYDADPYPVIVGGRVLWVQDAYTASSSYPYSQRANVERVPEGSDLRAGFNYARNSVKVVIDAYDGTTKFYLVDDKDPVARAYARAFPELFSPNSEVSPDLRAHFRYPEDLFRVQTNMFGRYHITGPDDFYNAGDAWNISQDPGSGSPTAVTQQSPGGARQEKMDPTYLLLRLPGDADESFLILQPFVPASAAAQRQQNLTAFMTAKSDPEDYGKLQAFVMPRGVQIDGPAIVDARTSADAEISREITLLNQQGSEVLLGNVLVIPVENSLLYIRPLYVQSKRNPLPEFKKAIVVFGEKAVMRDSLQDALAAVFGDAPATLEQSAPGQTPAAPGAPAAPGRPAGGPPADIAQLLSEAQAAYDAAQVALRSGNLAEYQRQITVVGDILGRVRQTQGAGGGGGPPPPR
ncbi:MAG: UPF0182 family protein [Actinomycetota bacterium]|nr:UPF0182 family protein [Actinomycetota bacterium]